MTANCYNSAQHILNTTSQRGLTLHCKLSRCICSAKWPYFLTWNSVLWTNLEMLPYHHHPWFLNGLNLLSKPKESWVLELKTIIFTETITRSQPQKIACPVNNIPTIWIWNKECKEIFADINSDPLVDHVKTQGMEDVIEETMCTEENCWLLSL